MKRYLFLLILILVFVNCGGSSNPSTSRSNKETKRKQLAEEKNLNLAPDFTLVDLDGNEHTLSNYRGKVVIIDFWATFCPPCRLEIPHFIQFYNKYKDDGLVILGVGLDREEKLKPFSKAMGITYPILIGDMATAEKYGIQPIPTTFILNRNGEIKDKIIGYAPGYEDKIRASFLKLL